MLKGILIGLGVLVLLVVAGAFTLFYKVGKMDDYEEDY